MKLQALRGMVDLLPSETVLWQEIEAIARIHFQCAAIKEIRTPLLEATELFSRGIGENTDVVGKEMYSFHDKGDRNCTLRPEGTASIVRAVIQNGLLHKGPQRLWYSGPMFRYERPQAGRQRQFHQLGAEFLGFSDARSDIEAIAIAWDLLSTIGLKELTLELNTLGDLQDRINFKQILVIWLKERYQKLDKDSQKRIDNNPMRILDSKVPETQELLSDAPLLSDHLSTSSRQRFNTVKQGLQELGIPFKINSLLVRGLDYYSHTAFEIKSNQLGAQSTICGGGRYNGLVEQLGGPPTASFGWALGMERLVLLLSKIDGRRKISGPDFYIVTRGNTAQTEGLKVTRSLRLQKKRVEIDHSGASFSKQLKRANKSGARWAIIIGDEEAERRKFILKDLRSESGSEDQLLDLENLLKDF